ncbi:RNA-binding protein 34 [Denticeps clupeoides]|uniref:RRM domain-containing protein n=1 Tax=Denticeps clupeoides TaxID=299321 RepID=A0AAY4EMZ7_9TELE|nr:RNA-binding protein 34 [Denticeps clupeoides]
MKTKTAKQESNAAEYVVGQVSGSLFPQKSSRGSGCLSALFPTAPSPGALLYVPAPKLEPKPTASKDEAARGKCSKNLSEQKKDQKLKSAAQLKLEGRESSLQNADEDDQVKKNSKKRKVLQTEDDCPEDNKGRHSKRVRTFKDMAEERVKMKRTVFVGNLPVSYTKKALQILFRDQGDLIESIRFRSVVREDPTLSRKVATIQRKVHPKAQSINAYVVFKEEQGAVNALKKNGLEVQKNYHIRVDRVSKHSMHDHKRSIFIGNLSYEIADLQLREHFQECGPVEAVRLVRDQESGMGKGFGYILFVSADAVQLALKLDGSTLLGRKIRVKRSVKKQKQKSDSGGEKGPQGKNTKGFGKRASEGRSAGGRQNKTAGGRPFQKNPGKFVKMTAGSFKGEMTDPTAKKGQKKKLQQKKKMGKKKKQAVHI